MQFKSIYQVRRNDGADEPGGKHSNCTLLVLDIDCDKYARIALEAYAAACEKELPLVAEELRSRLAVKHTNPVLKGIQERMRELERTRTIPELTPVEKLVAEKPKMSRDEELSKMFSGEIKRKRGRPKKVQ